MKQCMLLISGFILLFVIQVRAQTQIQPKERVVDFPEIPRVSAMEAYVKYKNGKAIILHGGGVAYKERHIIGALNFDFKDREERIKRLPKKGFEIFTYCY